MVSTAASIGAVPMPAQLPVFHHPSALPVGAVGAALLRFPDAASFRRR